MSSSFLKTSRHYSITCHYLFKYPVINLKCNSFRNFLIPSVFNNNSKSTLKLTLTLSHLHQQLSLHNYTLLDITTQTIILLNRLLHLKPYLSHTLLISQCFNNNHKFSVKIYVTLYFSKCSAYVDSSLTACHFHSISDYKTRSMTYVNMINS